MCEHLRFQFRFDFSKSKRFYFEIFPVSFFSIIWLGFGSKIRVKKRVGRLTPERPPDFVGRLWAVFWELVFLRRRGTRFGFRIYAFPHNLSKKGLKGMKPSSSSLGASSSRSFMVSSLGISSPKMSSFEDYYCNEFLPKFGFQTCFGQNRN